MPSVDLCNLDCAGNLHMSVSESLAAPRNRLLAALPAEDYQRLVPHLELVMLSTEQILCDFGELPDYVYFPLQSAISVVNLMADGSMTEVGLIGQEGMVGIQVILGGSTMPYQSFVQVADSAM
jgi:CRP-like cAMP-binding protein